MTHDQLEGITVAVATLAGMLVGALVALVVNTLADRRRRRRS